MAVRLAGRPDRPDCNLLLEQRGVDVEGHKELKMDCAAYYKAWNKIKDSSLGIKVSVSSVPIVEKICGEDIVPLFLCSFSSVLLLRPGLPVSGSAWFLKISLL